MFEVPETLQNGNIEQFCSGLSALDLCKGNRDFKEVIETFGF